MKILDRFNGNVIFELECDSIKECILAANKTGADLIGADLSGADLRGAELRGANLMGADLSGADFMGAELRDADLRDADLRGANLIGANLRDADLSDANLWGEKITKTPIYINAGLNWQVWITDKRIKIGCQIHSTSFWEKASDNVISQMSSDALDFWNKWKLPILTLAKEHQKEDK